jgi:hypothetical protein
MTDIERPTRDYLRKLLTEDFEIFEGWRGKHKHNGESVCYDLVLSPRQHLLSRNFDQGYIVVEVKLFNPHDKKKHDTKAKDLLWQCIVYSFSEILLPNGHVQAPLFVLYFIGGEGIEERYKERLGFLHHFVQRGGVGRLDFDHSGGWEMIFGGSYYFRQRFGRGPCNVGTKRMTGSLR